MRIFLKNFYPYIKNYKILFAISIIAGIITALCTSTIAYLIKPVLDDLFIKKDANMLVILPFIIVIAYFGKSISSYIQTYYMNYIGQDIVRNIRNILLKHMLTLEMDFFNKKRSGELVSRITNDIELIRTAVSNHIADFARESVTMIGLIIIVIYQSPKLAMLGLLIIPLALIPTEFISNKIKKNAKKLMIQNSDITSKLNEIFNNAEIIKATNGEKIENEYFSNENLNFFKINMKLVRLNQLISPLMEFLGALVIALIIFIGGKEVIKGALTSGEFFSFMTALFMIYTPLKRIMSAYAGFSTAIPAEKRIFEILNRKPKINDGHIHLKNNIESIKFRNVNLKYDDNQVLFNINLDLHKNEIIALRGKSGSGKSSIVNLILRLYEPSSGDILINSKNITQYTQESIRDNIAVVTQRIFIFNDTIAANVAYGNKFDENMIIQALKMSYAWNFIKTLPFGIYTKLDEFGTNLSGGQRQRIAIARAIYKNPRILIFDEATSALDEITENLIKDTINKIRKEKIIFLITHRPSTLSIATKIIDIEEGVVKNIKINNIS